MIKIGSDRVKLAERLRCLEVELAGCPDPGRFSTKRESWRPPGISVKQARWLEWLDMIAIKYTACLGAEQYAFYVGHGWGTCADVHARTAFPYPGKSGRIVLTFGVRPGAQ